VPVFDVSQTEGEELPAVCEKLTGGAPPDCIYRLTDAAKSIGYSVEYTILPEGLNGDCAFDLRRIRVEARNSPAQRAKTLTHEIAHALLHEDRTDRRLAELEAESTAYVVCRNLGLDTGRYSFGYVASWAGGGDLALAGIKASGAHIQAAARTILTHLGIGEPEEVVAGVDDTSASAERRDSLPTEEAHAGPHGHRLDRTSPMNDRPGSGRVTERHPGPSWRAAVVSHPTNHEPPVEDRPWPCQRIPATSS
jgi:hypothetical protein